MKRLALILLLLTSNIYSETINSYELPPEPDQEINNATLLGIDSNNNGVRDDVERWIYHTYSSPIERGLLMQFSRAYQKVIVNPSQALQTKKYVDNASSCEFYFLENNKNFLNKYEYVYFTKEMRRVQFNTLKRHIAYEKYQGALSGGVYSSSPALKNKCEFDENGILKTLNDK